MGKRKGVYVLLEALVAPQTDALNLDASIDVVAGVASNNTVD